MERETKVATLVFALLFTGVLSSFIRHHWEGGSFDTMVDNKKNITDEDLLDAGIDLKGSDSQFIIATDLKAHRVLNEMIAHSPPGKQGGPYETYSPIQVGKLSVCLVANPGSWADTQESNAEWLDVDIDGRDLLIIELLTKTDQTGATQFPMLKRIHSLQDDVLFAASEVLTLREECLSARSSKNSAAETDTITKLLVISENALERGYGIYLASD